jgi:hypothetical protein
VQSRPQPNRRRGILRATLVVVVLTAFLLIAILIFSSITAPPATAPLVPPTPGPLVTPVLPPTARPATTHVRSPITTSPKKKARRPITTSPRPTPTAAKKVLGQAPGNTTPTFMEAQPQSEVSHLAAVDTKWPDSASLSPDRRLVAFFRRGKDAYAPSALYVSSLVSRVTIRVGAGDFLIPPVWSVDSDAILYVRVRQVRSLPLASWSLVSYDLRTRVTSTRAVLSGLNLAPLGLRPSGALFMVASSTDTALFSATGGHQSLLGILLSQPLASARESPDGSYIAFAAPTNCSYCTLDVYDVSKKSTWVGPSALTNERTFTWSTRHLLVALIGSKLAVINVLSHSISWYARPGGLPDYWPHELRALVRPDKIILTDWLDHRSYVTSESSRD